eukprot:2468047-Rhodomonas_salina.1
MPHVSAAAAPHHHGAVPGALQPPFSHTLAPLPSPKFLPNFVLQRLRATPPTRYKRPICTAHDIYYHKVSLCSYHISPQ